MEREPNYGRMFFAAVVVVGVLVWALWNSWGNT
jgi:hypothetical protein